MLEDYLGENYKEPVKTVVPKAVPKLYDYRERFKKKSLTKNDLIAKPAFKRIVQQNSGEFDSISRKAGENLFFGPGTEIDL